MSPPRSRLLKALDVLLAVFFMLFQQAMVIGVGIILYSQYASWAGILCWCACLPMVWLNRWTWNFMMEYGFVRFITANSDTSELDVRPENRPYRKK